MTFIVLAFTACLSAQPAHCEPRQLTFSAHSVTIMQCITQGQAALAQWSAQNPRWTIAGRHSCGISDGREADA